MKEIHIPTRFLAEILRARVEQYKGILVNKKQVYHFFDQFVQFIFPSPASDLSMDSVEMDWHSLQSQLEEIFKCMNYHSSSDLLRKDVIAFFEVVPSIYRDLLLDADTLLLFDPAAKSKAEVILAYPGFYAVTAYRIGHALHVLGIPIIPRMIAEYAHSQTGIDIHPAAIIGSHFLIDHGTGIVIGETAIIGDYVKIYQGVTLGALSVEKKDANIKRHPTIENNVIIYAGATILGGNTIVGANSIIGGNVWLVRSVEPYSIVYNQSKVDIQQKPMQANPSNFSI